MVMLTLIGSAGAEILSKLSAELGVKLTEGLLRRVPGRVLIEINKRVGFRLVTKAGTKGLVNLSKAVPIVGGVAGGTVNAYSTRAVGHWAKRNFPAV